MMDNKTKKENSVFVKVKFNKETPGNAKGAERVYHRSTAEALEARGLAKIVEQLPKFTHPAIKK